MGHLYKFVEIGYKISSSIARGSVTINHHFEVEPTKHIGNLQINLQTYICVFLKVLWYCILFVIQAP